MSLVKLGQTDEAKKLFQAMADSASHFLAGLGYLGLGDKDKARQELTQTLETSPDHLGAKEALTRIAR